RRHTRWPRDWSSDVCSSDLSIWAAMKDATLNPMVKARVINISLGEYVTFPHQKECRETLGPSQCGAALRAAWNRVAEFVTRQGRSEERSVGKECRCRVGVEE